MTNKEIERIIRFVTDEAWSIALKGDAPPAVCLAIEALSDDPTRRAALVTAICADRVVASKFGSASMLFDGAGDFISTPDFGGEKPWPYLQIAGGRMFVDGEDAGPASCTQAEVEEARVIECWECGCKRQDDGTTCDTCGAPRAEPFQPCVIVLDDPKRTEIVLSDCATVWVIHDDIGGVDFGYDMETGELVAIRAYGDRSRRPATV